MQSSSMALEDITYVIENLEWIRLLETKSRLILLNLKPKTNLINRNSPKLVLI
jgi:hypothetical protein